MQIVTAAIIRDNGKILIAQRQKGDHLEDHWEFPGGTLKENESLEQCLARELKEELGVDSTIGKLVAKKEHNSGGKEIELWFYEATVSSKDFTLTAHQEVRWINFNDINNFELAEADKDVLSHLG